MQLQDTGYETVYIIQRIGCVTVDVLRSIRLQGKKLRLL